MANRKGGLKPVIIAVAIFAGLFVSIFLIGKLVEWMWVKWEQFNAKKPETITEAKKAQ